MYYLRRLYSLQKRYNCCFGTTGPISTKLQPFILLSNNNRSVYTVNKYRKVPWVRFQVQFYSFINYNVTAFWGSSGTLVLLRSSTTKLCCLSC